jgi:hypothetical protein
LDYFPLGLLEASPFTRSPTGSQATQVYLTSLGYLRPPTFLERGNLHLGFPKQTRRRHFFGQFCGETKHASSILHKRRKIGLKILFENATLKTVETVDVFLLSSSGSRRIVSI